jgi:hypothetical protein
LFIYDGKTGETQGEIENPAHKGGIYDVGELLYITIMVFW